MSNTPRPLTFSLCQIPQFLFNRVQIHSTRSSAAISTSFRLYPSSGFGGLQRHSLLVTSHSTVARCTTLAKLAPPTKPHATLVLPLSVSPSPSLSLSSSSFPLTSSLSHRTSSTSSPSSRAALLTKHFSSSPNSQFSTAHSPTMSYSKAPSEYSVRKVGQPNTVEYRAFIEKDGVPVSPFHDIPLYANEQQTILNMIVEIPRWTNAKQEVSGVTKKKKKVFSFLYYLGPVDIC